MHIGTKVDIASIAVQTKLSVNFYSIQFPILKSWTQEERPSLDLTLMLLMI